MTKRIPKLSAAQLQNALARLETLKISPKAKKQLASMLRSSSNEASGQIDVVIASLERERQQAVAEAAKAVTAVTNSVLGRAANGLQAMSESEWTKLVEQANGD